MIWAKELYERTIQNKDFEKVKNKIYDILGLFAIYDPKHRPECGRKLR